VKKPYKIKVYDRHTRRWVYISPLALDLDRDGRFILPVTKI